MPEQNVYYNIFINCMQEDAYGFLLFDYWDIMKLKYIIQNKQMFSCKIDVATPRKTTVQLQKNTKNLEIFYDST